MKIFKSIFWLSVAFVAIGPNVNAVDSAGQLSRQAAQDGASLVDQHLGKIDCQTIECMGGKAVISAGLNMVPQEAEHFFEEPALPEQVVPIPHPRLVRNG